MQQLLNKIFATFGKIGKDRYMHFAFGAAIAAVAVIATCWLPSWLSLVISAIIVTASALGRGLLIDHSEGYIDEVVVICGGLFVLLPSILLIC